MALAGEPVDVLRLDRLRGLDVHPHRHHRGSPLSTGDAGKVVEMYRKARTGIIGWRLERLERSSSPCSSSNADGPLRRAITAAQNEQAPTA